MKKQKILIIEDETIIALNIKRILESKGYEVCDTGMSADEAVNLTEKHNPGLILVDIILNGEKDGISAVEEIKKKHDIPVVYITAHSDEKTLQRAKKTEPHGYIIKPLSREELLSTVEIALYKHEMEGKLKLTQFSVDRTEDAVYWMGPDARFIYVNDAACNALGYSREELLTMNMHDIGPDFPEEVWPAHWEDLRKRGSFLIETIHQAKDGGIFPVEISVNYIKQGNNEFNCAIARDVTERKRAEAERNLFYNSSTDLICTIDFNRKFIEVNPAWGKITGWADKELIGKFYTEFIHPDDLGITKKTGDKHRDSGEPVISFQNRFRRKDGSYRWLSWNVNIFPEKKRMFCIARDISRRKKAEEVIIQKSEELDAANEELQATNEELETAIEELTQTNEEFESANEELIETQNVLEESEKRLKKYINIAGVMLIVIDKNRIVTLANSKCCEILECSENDITGKNWFDNFIPEIDREKTVETFKMIMNGIIEPVEYFENYVLTASGKNRLISWHNTVIRDENGNILSTLSSGEDITGAG